MIAETREETVRKPLLSSRLLAPARTWLSRTGRVIRLDATVFQEIASDRRATLQGLAVVLLAAGATVIGTLDEEGADALRTLPQQLFLGYLGWITGTLLVYILGTRVVGTPRGDVGWAVIARVMGYAHAPVLLRLIALLPGIGLATVVLTLIWQGLAILTSIKEVLAYRSYWKPLAILAMGLIPYLAVIAGFNLLL